MNLGIKQFGFIIALNFICATRLEAQTFIGLSVNLGDVVKETPSSNGIKSIPSVSGNFSLEFRKNLGSNVFLSYGVGLGVLGYTLKVVTIDSLSPKDKFLFPEYSNFYGKLSLALSKEFIISGRPIALGVSGGASHYYSFFPTTSFSISVEDDTQEYTTFEGQTSVQTKALVGFANVFLRKEVNSRISFKLAYSYHVAPALTGTYKFYHTERVSAGNISIYQRELSLMILFKTSRH